MKQLINRKTVLILISSLVISIFLLSFILIGATRERVNAIDIEEELKVTTTIKVEKNIFVDVKGAVKKPGVYEVKENSIVNDCIKLAGGITSSGTLSNINLSKKVTDEMVIYVFKKSEITTSAKNEIPCTTEVIEINNCPIITDNQTSNDGKKETTTNAIDKKININTATKEELTTLTGIGESKANSIIEYRKTNQFKSIEELKNVSGIGEALYESIKDSITV